MSRNISKTHTPNPVGMSAIVTADTKERSGNMNPNLDRSLLEDLIVDWTVSADNGEICQNDEERYLRPYKGKGKLKNYPHLPVPYDQNAMARHFMRILKEICQDDENDNDWGRKACLISEAMGYILLPSCKAQKLFLLTGDDVVGKYAVLKIISALTGVEYAPILWPTPLAGRNESLYAECFLYNPAHPPIDRKERKDFFRRLIIIPLNRKERNEDVEKYLNEQLEAELPGILNHVLKALSRLKRRGRFDEPESCLEFKREWQSEAKQLAAFTKDCHDIRPWHKDTTKELYEVYLRWAGRTDADPLDKWVLVQCLVAGYGLKTHRYCTHKSLLPDVCISWSR